MVISQAAYVIQGEGNQSSSGANCIWSTPCKYKRNDTMYVTKIMLLRRLWGERKLVVAY